MSWRAQNRSKDAKTPSGSRGRSEKPEPGLWPVQQYLYIVDLGVLVFVSGIFSTPYSRTTRLRVKLPLRHHR
jgi:hypothetical protein